SESTSFSFTNFNPNQENLILQEDALVNSKGTLELTKNGKPVPESLGRNCTTLASFTTSFSFVMSAPNSLDVADGLAFFLAPPDTQPQKRGGFLGLFKDRKHDISYQSVAVEFDTYSNVWDPNTTHIGIDTNTIESKKITPFDMVYGEKILFASLVFPVSQDILPEYVRVGFSATTGLNEGVVETH
uniref:Lectin B4 (Fragments) n=1 Tax=Vicia villosa TaxID=3911 RepID=LEC_VICVI|nr:RecName: Full=Lectin B4; AltName: Full=VVLB4 [Vicia villosa]